MVDWDHKEWAEDEKARKAEAMVHNKKEGNKAPSENEGKNWKGKGREDEAMKNWYLN